MPTIDIDFEWGVGREYQLVDDQTVIRQTSRHHDWKRAILRHHHALTVFL